MVKYCKNCGSKLEEGAVFCDECGTKVGKSSPGVSPSNDVFSSYKIDMMDGGIGIIIGMISFISTVRYGYFFGIFGFFNGFTIAGSIWLIIRFIGYKTNDLILTNKRVFGKSGLISTTQMQSSLKKIDSVSYKNGLIGKLIGYGTVISESEKIKQNAKAIADEIKE